MGGPGVSPLPRPGLALTYAVEVRGGKVAVAVHQPSAHRPHGRSWLASPWNPPAQPRPGTSRRRRSEFPAAPGHFPPVALASAPRVPAPASNWENGGGSRVGEPFTSAGRGAGGRDRRPHPGPRHSPRGLPRALHLEAGGAGAGGTVRPLRATARGRAAGGDSGARAARRAVGTGPIVGTCPFTHFPGLGAREAARAELAVPTLRKSSRRSARGRDRSSGRRALIT